MTHLGDITKIDWFHVPPVDVVTGGSPCQDLSVAGKRAGLAGERSGLYMEQIRCVKELRQADEQRGRTGFAIRPRYMVWENVPGAFSSNGGEDFRAALEEAAKIAQPNAVIPQPPKGKWTNSGAIMGDGWSIAWRVHDAQFWGVPQRRKRIALVCDFGGLSAPEILFERKGLSRDSEPCGEEREGTAAPTGGGAEGASGAMNPLDSQTARVYPDNGVWHCLNANENGGQSRDAVFCPQGNGANIVVQSAEPTPINTMITTRCKALGRGTGFGVSNPGDPAFTISAAHEHGCPPLVAGFKHKASGMARGIGYEEEKAPSLIAGQESAVYDARGNGDGKTVCTITGDHENSVTDYTALCVGNGQANQSVSDKAGALNTMHDQQAILTTEGVGSQYVEEGKVIPQNAIVRRLTPLECERLQGYPDGWTNIGEWVDSNGKKHGEADSPRYKALGNSIALPFWFWLLRRISAQYIGPATLGSLFDGIGGFPLCWERCNGKGTALWASEIEEFPMAVTRRHFGEDEWHDIEIFEKWAQEEEGL